MKIEEYKEPSSTQNTVDENQFHENYQCNTKEDPNIKRSNMEKEKWVTFMFIGNTGSNATKFRDSN